MAGTTVGMVPEFTSDETVGAGIAEEVKETTPETEIAETETPAELPAEQVETPEEKPAPEQSVSDDMGSLIKQISGLQGERGKLLQEIQELRGSRRELRQETGPKDEKLIQPASDDLKDINNEDITAMERILRAKGYVTKTEYQQMYYDAVKQEELTKFLEKYPEYKPENDPNDYNWSTLKQEYAIYAPPSDPKLIGDRLERAHKGIAKPSHEQVVAPKKQQVKTASVGSRGIQRPSSEKSLTPEQREIYRSGGFSEADITAIESRL